MVVIVWLLDLQLSVQSVPITINVVSSNLVHHEVYSMQQYVIKFVSNLRQVGGFLNITEILFKVVLITINQTKLIALVIITMYINLRNRTYVIPSSDFHLCHASSGILNHLLPFYVNRVH